MRGRLHLLFFVLAILGLVLSLIVHVATFADVDLIDTFPAFWVLHLGIFMVFIPCLLVGAKPRRYREPLPAKPRWLSRLVYLFFIYAGVNFIIFLFLIREGTAQRLDDGTYMLAHRAHRVRAITEAEFHHQNALVARGFSGHWMLFYCMTVLLLWPRKEKPPEPAGG
ncbi:MAG: hypothetical protein U0793_26340 [Gemmataceae bacterium]